MDGGGRLLRSLTESSAGLFALSRPRFAGLPDSFDNGPVQFRNNTRRRSRAPKGFHLPALLPRTTRGGVGIALTIALFAATGLYGAVRGGQYQAFVAANGSPLDVAAKLVGFPIDAITISGIKELDQTEILKAAAIDPSHSLLFLDAASVRERLRALPLVRNAVVTKLFPDRLTIAIDERDPVALWQINGHLSIVSADGVVIDDVHDDRFLTLPFVVGEGANGRVSEFLALLDAAGDLRSRILAGVLVGERRWTLKMDSGIEVALPETGAAEAMARLALLQKQSKLLDKDLVSVDLRDPERITARLSDDAAAARVDMLAKRPKRKVIPE